jgi:hypothetical protein
VHERLCREGGAIQHPVRGKAQRIISVMFRHSRRHSQLSYTVCTKVNSIEHQALPAKQAHPRVLRRHAELTRGLAIFQDGEVFLIWRNPEDFDGARSMVLAWTTLKNGSPL